MGLFSEAVLDHFQNPRNAGELPDATATAVASNPACGDTLWLAVRVEKGRIAAVRFQSRGCTTSIASGSVLTELMLGRTVKEARAITAVEISKALGRLPTATYHGAQLACDALEAVLAGMV